MKRKEYEKALRKLQVELCALQDWVKHGGPARCRDLRRTRRRREGRHDQGHHRASQSSRVPGGGAARAVRSRKGADYICSVTCRTFRPRARS